MQSFFHSATAEQEMELLNSFQKAQILKQQTDINFFSAITLFSTALGEDDTACIGNNKECTSELCTTKFETHKIKQFIHKCKRQI